MPTETLILPYRDSLSRGLNTAESGWIRAIDKQVLNGESLRQMFTQGLNPVPLSGMMPGGKKAKSVFTCDMSRRL